MKIARISLSLQHPSVHLLAAAEVAPAHQAEGGAPPLQLGPVGGAGAGAALGVLDTLQQQQRPPLPSPLMLGVGPVALASAGGGEPGGQVAGEVRGALASAMVGPESMRLRDDHDDQVRRCGADLAAELPRRLPDEPCERVWCPGAL